MDRWISTDMTGQTCIGTSDRRTRLAFLQRPEEPGNTMRSVRTPRRQGRIGPRRCVELLEESAAGSHLAASRQRKQAGCRASVVGRIQQGDAPNFKPGHLPERFANHESAHAVADEVHGRIELLEFRGESFAERFDRRTSAIVVAPDPAGAHFAHDAAAKALPARVRTPDPVEDKRSRALPGFGRLTLAGEDGQA